MGNHHNMSRFPNIIQRKEMYLSDLADLEHELNINTNMALRVWLLAISFLRT